MAKPNLKSQAKRKRELAKLDKRQEKDRKRALRRAEGSEPAAVITAAVAPAKSVPHAAGQKPSLSSVRGVGAVVAPVATPARPLTLGEAAERWRTSRVAKPKTR